MIVKVINDIGIAVFKAKNQPPVCTDFNTPKSVKIMFQRMQIHSTTAHVLYFLGRVQQEQQRGQFLAVFGLNAAGVVFEEEAFESLVGEALNHCKSSGYLCIVLRNDTQFNLSMKRLQIGQKRGYSLPITAHTAVIGISLLPINRRTGALQRCFYARFLWQCAWENRKVRRFFRSGKANPAFAVALFISLNGDSHLLIRKETAMSCHITLVLGDATDTDYETLSIYAAALLRALSLAHTDPDFRLSAPDTCFILDLIEQLAAQKDAAHAEVMGGAA